MRRCGLFWTLLLGGCATESEGTQDTGVCSVLTHQNFGAAFMVEHCQGCHSSYLLEGERAGAPTNISFDTEADVVQWVDLIVREISTQRMPPMGGIAEAELQRSLEWLDCLKGAQE